MSADVVNLNRARKQKARADKAVKAAENRALFGQTRVERDAVKFTRERLDRGLDGHRLRTGDEDAS